MTSIAAASGTSAPRILIVDDDEVVARSVYQQLVETGMSVDLATDSEGAERLLRTDSYALVLMDAYLTGHLSARAVELVDRVRALSPSAYIVLLTAYGSMRLTEHLRRHDRITVVAKPKSVSFIAELIHGLLPEIADNKESTT